MGLKGWTEDDGGFARDLAYEREQERLYAGWETDDFTLTVGTELEDIYVFKFKGRKNVDEAVEAGHTIARFMLLFCEPPEDDTGIYVRITCEQDEDTYRLLEYGIVNNQVMYREINGAWKELCR